jgi:hypothetical protein
MKRPGIVWLLVFLLTFLAFGGIYGGIAMLSDPTGSILQMQEVLPLLPVSNYVLPGFFLLTLMGILPLFIAYGLIVQPEWRWAETISTWSKHHWAWAGTIAIGMVLLIWLGVQGVLIGFQWPIQYATLLNGLLLLLVAVIPGVRKHYERSGKQ